MAKNGWRAAGLALVATVLVLGKTGGQASAAGTVVVTTGDPGWLFFSETPTGSGAFTYGPAAPPLGGGSAQLTVNATGGEILGTAAYVGTRLDAITSLSYSAYRVSGSAALAPSLQLDIDTNVTDANVAWQGRLVYEPYFTHAVSTGTWQTWNPLDNAGTGNWWFTGAPGNAKCPLNNPCTWAEVLANFPNAGIRNAGANTGIVQFKAGGGWASGFVGNVDAFRIGINNVVTTYDFELPFTVPTTSSIGPTAASIGTSDLTLTVNGTNFFPSSTVQWNGSNRATTFVSATQLTAVISAADLASLGAVPVTVLNATPGGGVSNPQAFTVITAATDANAADFEAFAPGDVNGQYGWTSGHGSSLCPVYDVAVVPNTFGYARFGAQSLRVSNAITCGSFSDQTFSRSLADEAGETSALTGSFSGGTRQPYFEAQWDFASTVPGAEQPNLSVVASPDRGDTFRMSWVQMADTPTGLQVNFQDYQEAVQNFVSTPIASNLDRTVPHTVKLTLQFVDGAGNDVVKVYVDGVLAHTGTTWEDYYRDFGGGTPAAVDSVLFREAGTAAPATMGHGFLIDNFTSFTGPVPVIPALPATGRGAPSRAPATVNVVNIVVNDSGGTKTVKDFPLFVNGVLVASGETNVFSPAAAYDVTEGDVPGYTRVFSGDCDAAGRLSLNAGENKFCVVTNDDMGAVIPVPPVPPLIDLVKVPSPLALPNGPGPVTYTYTLRNIGAVPVAKVSMAGDSCGPIARVSGDANGDGVLDVGESWVYTCATTLQQTTTNTIVASGWANGLLAADIASATVLVNEPLVSPLIHVTEVPSPTVLLESGDPVTYAFTVTNPGAVALAGVQLVDSICGGMSYVSGDANGDKALDPSETWTYSCRTNLNQTTTNTVTASGTASGITVRDLAFSTVVVVGKGPSPVPALPETGLVPFVAEPAARLVKIADDAKVYAVALGGELRLLTNEAVARALYGTDWAQRISVVSAAQFEANYHVGAPLRPTDVTVPACTVAAPFKNSLAPGSVSAEVRSLQSLLQCLDDFPATVTPTGTFGAVTQAAVKKFQAANGLDPVGFLGPLTRGALNRYLAK